MENTTKDHILNPGFELSLRPMKYPQFYEMMNDAEKNTWSVEEIDFSQDLIHLKTKLTYAEQHLIKRLVAFFATGDSIVANNLVLNLFKHVNSPEARMFYGRMLWEETVHVKFYLTLLDNYVPDPAERAEAFAAVENIPSVARKAEFMNKWIDTIFDVDKLETQEHRRNFLLNLVCFATCVEGLFFFAAFAYVYFLRSKGLLHGLASGTNWVFRDESGHMNMAFALIDLVRKQEPELWDANMDKQVVDMLVEAVDCEAEFAADTLSGGVAGLSLGDMRLYLQYIADQRLARLGIPAHFGSKNPFAFMELQDVQELTNFFERKVSAYQTNVKGDVAFDEEF